MTARRRDLAALAVLWLGVSIAVGNPVSDPVLLRVAGQVPQPLELTSEAFARLKHENVRVKEAGGAEAEYRGVPVSALLSAAGIKLGNDLRGPALELYLVVEATDGYRAVFALPELDPAFSDRIILLADQRDGQPLAEKDGPLRIIVPGDKRHSRWVKHVAALRVGKAS